MATPKAASKKYLLIADDVLNLSPASQRRSRLIHYYAANLVEKVNAPVKLIYVKDPHHKLDFSDEARLREYLQDYYSERKISFTMIDKKGSPVEEILKMEQGPQKIGLVALGTEGRTGLDRLFLGSVAEEMIRHSSAPTMAIGPAIAEEAAKSPSRILVATDLTKGSRRAEAYAMKLAAALKTQIVFFHSCINTLRTADQYAAASGTNLIDQSVIDTICHSGEDAMKAKVKLCRTKGVRATYILNDEGPTTQEAIAKELEKGYQYLVIGTHGRNSLVSAFLGGTARKTLLLSSVPTIIVRSHLK